MRLDLAIPPSSHFVPMPRPTYGLGCSSCGRREFGRCVCQKRGLGQSTVSVPGIFQGGGYFSNLAAGINNLPSDLWFAISSPTTGTQATATAIQQGNIGSTISGIIQTGVQKAGQLWNNFFSGSISGQSPLSTPQFQAIQNDVHTQIDQAAAGNTQLAAQAKAQADQEMAAAANGVPPVITLPNLSDLTSGALNIATGISWQTWVVVGLVGIAGILVLRRVIA